MGCRMVTADRDTDNSLIAIERGLPKTAKLSPTEIQRRSRSCTKR